MIRSQPSSPSAATRALRVFVAVLLGATALLTAAQRLGASDAGWLELTRFLPFPVVLAPSLFALLLATRLGRGWTLASLASLALVASVTMGLEWHRGSPAGVGAMPIRLMTYNVKATLAAQRPDGMAALAREVARHDPDILVMQDAHDSTGAPAAELLSGGRVFGYPHVHAAGQYIVASRFALHGCVQRPIGPPSDEHRYLRCTVQAGPTALTLVTVHFDSPREGLNAARREGLEGFGEWQRNHDGRLAQARALATDLAPLLAPGAAPLIVAGDLNAPPSSPVMATLRTAGLRDAFSAAGRGYGYTYGHALRIGFRFLRIDHALVSAAIGVAACTTGGTDASQHRPVIAELRLGG